MPPKKYFTDEERRAAATARSKAFRKSPKAVAWREVNRERLAAADKAWRAANKEHLKAFEFFVYEMQRHHVLRRALLQRQERAFAT